MNSISTRIFFYNKNKTTNQAKHDLRLKIPSYVNQTKTHENSVLIAAKNGKEMFKMCNELRAQRNCKIAIRSDINVSIAGILTFSKEAQKIINKLDKKTQNELILSSIKEISNFMNAEITGIAIHRDETAIHCHYQICSYDKQGYPISNTLKMGDYSKLQDIAAGAFLDYGIGRGKPKKERILNGEDPATYIHMSVKELHEILPDRLKELRDKVEKEQTKINDYENYIKKNREKLQKGGKNLAKVLKNIKIYESRVNEKQNEIIAYNLDIAELEKKLQKYNEIINTENPPKPPKSRIIYESAGLLKKKEKEVIEVNDFKAFINKRDIWDAKEFDTENAKKAKELKEIEKKLAAKEKEISEKAKNIENIKIDRDYYKNEKIKKDEMLTKVAVKIANENGGNIKYLQSDKAEKIIESYLKNENNSNELLKIKR